MLYIDPLAEEQLASVSFQSERVQRTLFPPIMRMQISTITTENNTRNLYKVKVESAVWSSFPMVVCMDPKGMTLASDRDPGMATLTPELSMLAWM